MKRQPKEWGKYICERLVSRIYKKRFNNKRMTQFKNKRFE